MQQERKDNDDEQFSKRIDTVCVNGTTDYEAIKTLIYDAMVGDELDPDRQLGILTQCGLHDISVFGWLPPVKTPHASKLACELSMCTAGTDSVVFVHLGDGTGFVRRQLIDLAGIACSLKATRHLHVAIDSMVTNDVNFCAEVPLEQNTIMSDDLPSLRIINTPQVSGVSYNDTKAVLGIVDTHMTKYVPKEDRISVVLVASWLPNDMHEESDAIQWKQLRTAALDTIVKTLKQKANKVLILLVSHPNVDLCHGEELQTYIDNNTKPPLKLLQFNDELEYYMHMITRRISFRRFGQYVQLRTF